MSASPFVKGAAGMESHVRRDTLSSLEEHTLVRQAQSLEPRIANAATERILHHFRSLISTYGRNVTPDPEYRKDVDQELRIAFWKAIKNFDPMKGYRLASYVRKYLQ